LVYNQYTNIDERYNGLIKEKIYRDLKERIIRDELSAGQWLVERDLCSKYQISRTPMREVLQRLVSEGLLDLHKSKGYAVKTLSMKEIVEIFQAREAIECMLTRLACHNIDEHLTARLNELKLELEEVEIEKDIPGGVEIGRKFHDLISKTAKNSFLYEYYIGIKDLSALTRNISKRSVEIELKSKMEHLEILEALLKGDEEQSENCMRNHLRNTCERIVETHISDLKKTLNYLQS
jgi:DNA-binding GntR family transcriptional regulator